MDGMEFIGIAIGMSSVFAASFGAVYYKMIKMSGDISELKTKVSFVYDNLTVALDFKKDK
jgi:hypothetical protein